MIVKTIADRVEDYGDFVLGDYCNLSPLHFGVLKENIVSKLSMVRKWFKLLKK